MKQIAYQSMAADGLTGKDVSDILSTAVRFNAAHGITGLLLFDGSAFFQIIEGEADALAKLYAAIRRDPRHRDIDTLYDVEVASRDFPNWNMCGTLIPRGIRGPVNAPLFLPEQISAASQAAIDRFVYAEAA